MYDPQTRTLIESAPALDQLDLTRLSEEMTRAYTTIVAFRVRVRAAGQNFPEDLLAELERFRRLANTYEAYVALLPEGGQRQSAAFVAASAHHLVNRADRMRVNKIRTASRLERNSITSDISALLLFLIAGYQADAAEMAKQLSSNDMEAVESATISALRGLAEGSLSDVLALEINTNEIFDSFDYDEAATRELWLRLFQGIQHLAERLLDEGTSDPIAEFRAVKSDAISTFDLADLQVDGIDDLQFVSAFAGPHQLASLLIHAGETLLAQSVTQVPPPQGMHATWSDVLKALAKRRPYLWTNHILALKTKMLDRGTSVVLSLPTGAGKTTMAELKIASALASQAKVIYLVPTHALADQVKKQLHDAFPNFKVAGSSLGDGFYAEVGEDDLPPLMVMTPERCLTLLGILKDDFAKLGLVVFDECHLMHPKKQNAERRSVDAALCMLKLFEVAPNADFMLMSAMVSNHQELAEWIASVTKRPAIPIGIDWKPTRQARGCLCVSADEFEKLEGILRDGKKAAIVAHSKKPTAKPKITVPAPGVGIQRQMAALPLGLFCLRQTWNKSSLDYAVLALSDTRVPLSANKDWYITPNKNKVAVDIGARFASLGIKTLIFIQNKGHCESVAGGVAAILAENTTAPPFTANEMQMLSVATEEAGSEEAVLGSFDRLAVCHHGLLLPIERHLTESMFCRQDGAALLTATPTLAQGMNLPAEVVIIAGEMRREEGSAKATLLEAHELLNAAGRAGRAGHVADGLVLVIPEDVVSIEVAELKVGGKWFRLNDEIFGKTDQCLVIDDPMTSILDVMQTSTEPAETLLPYVVRRLPVDEDGGDVAATKFLNRSLAAFRAKKEKKTASDFDKAVKGALAFRKTIKKEKDITSWLDQLSVSSGTSLKILTSLDLALHGDGPIEHRTSRKWVDWFFDWLMREPAFALELFDCRSLVKLLRLDPDEERSTEANLPELLPKVQLLVRGWMNADSLQTLEANLGTPADKIGKCDHARELVIRRMPEISYAVGLLTQVHRGHLESEGSPDEMPLTLATLAACVRGGHRSPIHLAISFVWPVEISRSQCKVQRTLFGEDANAASHTELFRSVLKRVGKLVRTRYK